MTGYETKYKTYSKQPKDYTSENENGKYQIIDKGNASFDEDGGKRSYIRLSPLSGEGNAGELLLSVKYPANSDMTYSRNVLKDTTPSDYGTEGNWYYYIEPGDAEIQRFAKADLIQNASSLPLGAVIIA